MVPDRLRTAVVDAEARTRSRLLRLLDRQADIEVVGTGCSGRDAIDLIRARRPDLLFLEVQMTDLDGFDVLRAVQPAEAPATIFVTGCPRHAARAYEAHALDYLLKPFSDERFESALAHVRRCQRARRAGRLTAEAPTPWPAPAIRAAEPRGFLEHLVVRSAGRLTFLDVNAVDWIEAAGVYVHLHVGGTRHLYRASVSKLLERLDPRLFVRVHRSAAVNPRRIRELQPRARGDYTIVLENRTQLMLSRSYRPALERWLRQRL